MTQISLPLTPAARQTPRQFGLNELPVPMVYAAYRIIRDCNDAFAALFGATRDEIVGRSFARLYPEIGDFERRGKQWAGQFGGHRTYYDERVMARLDGQQFWCGVHGRSLAPAGDPFAEAVYCFQPINRPATETRVLTDRQRQILALVSQGKTNAEIAVETGLSRRTVEAHRARLMKAIGVRNGAELISWFLSDRRPTQAPAARTDGPAAS